MNRLVGVLTSIRSEIRSGTIGELEQAKEPLSYLRLNHSELGEEFDNLTTALIATLSETNFEHLTLHLNRICILRFEKGVRLSDIMAILDLYEKALKDAMALALHSELPILNRVRREIDALLDKARVYISEYFFQLYEKTVFQQFEQMRIINEVSAHLTSTLKLSEVLDFIVTNATKLFKADCGTILLLNTGGVFIAETGQGWKDPGSPQIVARYVGPEMGPVVFAERDELPKCLEDVFIIEQIRQITAMKLYIKDRLLGVLVIGSREEKELGIPEQRLFATFANNAAIAVDNAQLYGETDHKLQERVQEVTVLLEQNRAIMDCMREGVIAIDANGLITLANNEALRLLGCPPNILGKQIQIVIPNSQLPAVVHNRTAEYDQEQEIGRGSIITNRVPVIVNGEVIGAIATFRDAKDVKVLAAELIGVKSMVESMRSQSHEFINKLHAISGLIQMEQYDKVVELIHQIYQSKQDIISFLVKRIKDKATVGLLLGKISQAEELSIVLRVNPRSKLRELPAQFSSLAMVTVLGNLIGNAIEALVDLPAERRIIDVSIIQGAKYLSITVSDKGNGIPRKNVEVIFRKGFSTKQGNRGRGLTMVRQEVEVGQGVISVRSEVDKGTSFIVKIPNEPRCTQNAGREVTRWTQKLML